MLLVLRVSPASHRVDCQQQQVHTQGGGDHSSNGQAVDAHALTGSLADLQDMRQQQSPLVTRPEPWFGVDEMTAAGDGRMQWTAV